MARSDQDLSERLRHRLVEVVRPVAATAPRPGRPSTTARAAPRRARPATDGVDQTALRTLIRPADSGWTEDPGPQDLDDGAALEPSGRRPPPIPVTFERRHVVGGAVLLAVPLVGGGCGLVRAHHAGGVAEALRD